MKRESFVSTIFIVFLQIEGNLLKKYQCTFLKRVPSIFRINIEIVLTKDYRFMSPWLLFRKFIFPSVKLSKGNCHPESYCMIFSRDSDLRNSSVSPSVCLSVCLFVCLLSSCPNSSISSL